MDLLQRTLFKLIVVADFKSVKNKFIRQGIDDVEMIKSYLDDFKKLKSKFKNLGETGHIDYWGKRPWEEFKNFVDEKKESVSKTQEKKLEKLEGAKLIAENDFWLVYKIFTHKAARMYGSGTRWCITEETAKHWYDYYKNHDFYFFISKDRDSDDPFYKIAMTFSKNRDTVYFDAKDVSRKILPIEVYENFPEFQPEYDQDKTYQITKVIEKIRKDKIISEDIGEFLYDEYGIEPLKYDEKEDALILATYKDIAEFANSKYSRPSRLNDHHSNLKWCLRIISGDENLEPEMSLEGIDRNEIEKILKIIKTKHTEMYNEFITKVEKTTSFSEQYTSNDLEHIARYIESGEDYDLSNVFVFAWQDGMRSATESWLYKSIIGDLNNNKYLRFVGDYHLDNEVHVVVPLNELGDFSEDEMLSSFKTLGVDSLSYEYPEIEEVLDRLVEYHLSEYCAQEN